MIICYSSIFSTNSAISFFCTIFESFYIKVYCGKLNLSILHLFSKFFAQRQNFFDCSDNATMPRTCLHRVFGKWRYSFNHTFKASHRGNNFSIALPMRFCSASGGRGITKLARTAGFNSV